MSKFTVITGEGVAPAAVVEALLASGEPAREIQYAVIGENRFRDGRPTLIVKDMAHAERVVAATRAYAGKMKLMVDYDHQSLFGAKDGVGGKAPAAGWVDPAKLEVRADGIWGPVEWTAPASAALTAKEYRYISPILGFDKNTHEVTRIFNAGLTNTPAIDDLAAAASTDIHGNPMKSIALALGLAETATETEIAAAASALQANLNAAITAFGLKPGATTEEIAAAATALKAGDVDPTKYVPIEAVTQLQTQVAALTAGVVEDKATAAVDAATAAGKLAPALRDWGLDLAKKDLPKFEAFVAAATVVVPAGQRPAGGKTPTGELTLTDEQKAVCSTFGWSEDAYLATLKQEQGL